MLQNACEIITRLYQAATDSYKDPTRTVKFTIHGVVEVDASDDLPANALKRLAGYGTATDVQVGAPQARLQIVPLKQGRKPDAGCYTVDVEYRLGEDFVFENCRYKFSSWRYLLTVVDANTWRLEIGGDVFSTWVWPYRTVGNLIKLLLGRYGYWPLHAAGFHTSGGAVMMLAPSGTGKTLTTLHVLCDGGRVYNDDTVLYHDGMLVPTFRALSFWEHRYRADRSVLPANLPELAAEDRSRIRRMGLLSRLTGGIVGLGSPLSADRYWPDATPPPAPVIRIVALRKSQRFHISREADVAMLQSRLFSDLRFQSLPLLRLVDVCRLTGVLPVDCASWYGSARQVIEGLFATCEVIDVEIPGNYSREIYEELKPLIT